MALLTPIATCACAHRIARPKLRDGQGFYKAWSNPAGAMFAAALERLAMQVRMTSAATPAELESRVEQLEEDAREAWQARAYDDGHAAGLREAYPAGAAFGHPA